MLPFRPQPNNQYLDLVISEHAFTSEECDRIIQMGVPSKAGRVMGTDSGERNSTIGWIQLTEDSRWLQEKIARIVMQANQNYFHFDLAGLYESLQVAEYQQGGFYDWHTDYGAHDVSIRKLSVVVQLTQPGNYEGGGLEFLTGRMEEEATKKKDMMIKQQGALIIFPSFVSHRVRPVVSGRRFSLAGWVSGQPFR